MLTLAVIVLNAFCIVHLKSEAVSPNGVQEKLNNGSGPENVLLDGRQKIDQDNPTNPDNVLINDETTIPPNSTMQFESKLRSPRSDNERIQFQDLIMLMALLQNGFLARRRARAASFPPMKGIVEKRDVDLRPPMMGARPPMMGKRAAGRPPMMGVRPPMMGIQKRSARPPMMGLEKRSVDARPPMMGLEKRSVDARPPMMGIRPPMFGLEKRAVNMARPPMFGARPPFGVQKRSSDLRPPMMGKRSADMARPPMMGARPPMMGLEKRSIDARPPMMGARPPMFGLQKRAADMARPPMMGLEKRSIDARPPMMGIRPPMFGLEKRAADMARPPMMGARPPMMGLEKRSIDARPPMMGMVQKRQVIGNWTCAGGVVCKETESSPPMAAIWSEKGRIMQNGTLTTDNGQVFIKALGDDKMAAPITITAISKMNKTITAAKN